MECESAQDLSHEVCDVHHQQRLYVELLDFGGAQSISRTSHCTFDLGNLRILNCTYSRVLSFPSVILKFLRGIFHERRHLVEIHLQIMYRFFASLSADLMRTAWKNFNSSVSTSCVSNLTMVYFLPSFRSCCSSTPALGNHLSVQHEHCLLS